MIRLAHFSGWSVLVAAVLVSGLLRVPQAVANDPNTVVAQIVLHEDGSRTEHVRNPQNRTLKTFTRQADGVLVRRNLFRLNAAGEPTACQIFDGADNLIYRVRYLYDDLGRLREEGTYNRAGKLVRRVVHRYDQNGKAKQPVAVNYPDAERQPIAPIAPRLTPGGLIRDR